MSSPPGVFQAILCMSWKLQPVRRRPRSHRDEAEGQLDDHLPRVILDLLAADKPNATVDAVLAQAVVNGFAGLAVSLRIDPDAEQGAPAMQLCGLASGETGKT
jgi:hypothetical protein